MSKEKADLQSHSKVRPIGMLGFIRISQANFRPYWKHVSVIVAALLIQTAFKVCLPLGYAQIFDGAIAQDDMAYLGLLLLLLVGAWVLNCGSGLIQDRYTAEAGANVLNDLRLKMFRQLQRVPISYYRQRDSGDLMSLFSNDLAAVEVVYLRSIYTVIYSAIVLALSVGLLFFIEWRLALITFASLPIALVGPRLIGGKAQRQNYERKDYEATVNAVLTENVGTATEIRVFGLQKLRRAIFDSHLAELATRIKRAFVTSALVGRTSSQTVQLVQIVIMGFGGYLAIGGHLTVGALVGFTALLMNVSNAANHLSSAIPEVLPASAALQRIYGFLAVESVQQANDEQQAFPDFTEIRFDQVSFSYAENARLALADATFCIPAGASVAVVGSSGSGKSTILNLLLRLYHPSSGQVCFDEIELDAISEASLRRQTSVVMQNTLLFNASFRENISMGHPEVDIESVIHAAKEAEIHEFINGLPQGYDTQVGEWGGSLSGGQRQRIAIARAMLRSPRVLVLDEATSALDPATEQAINQTLSHFTQGRTVISTTHRLNSVQNADLILVMQDGCVAEQGTHSELRALGGVYSALWEKQSGFDVTAEGDAVITAQRLAAIPLLSSISEARLQAMKASEVFVSERFASDQTLFSEGDQGGKFYIIVHGKVEVKWQDKDSGQETVQFLEDGDYFGEMALLDDAPRNATVRTVADSLMLSLDRRKFGALLENEPSLRVAIEEEVRTRIATRS